MVAYLNSYCRLHRDLPGEELEAAGAGNFVGSCNQSRCHIVSGLETGCRVHEDFHQW